MPNIAVIGSCQDFFLGGGAGGAKNLPSETFFGLKGLGKRLK